MKTDLFIHLPFTTSHFNLALFMQGGSGDMLRRLEVSGDIEEPLDDPLITLGTLSTLLVSL